MKIYRHRAITLANELARIALSEVDAMSLQAAMINYDVLRKVKEDYSALEKELFKRIYGDVEKMNEGTGTAHLAPISQAKSAASLAFILFPTPLMGRKAKSTPSSQSSSTSSITS